MGERGQAAVEAALTLPLTIFMVVGALQLFLMLQARLLAEHAAFRATRTGSLSQGSCTRMKQAALLTLLPAFTRTDTPIRVADAFRARIGNVYDASLDSQHNGAIVWLQRRLINSGGFPVAGKEDLSFDDPDRFDLLTLEVGLTFWYPMRIPFANWVIGRTMLAAWGLGNRDAINPLLMAQTSHWATSGPPPASLSAQVLSEFSSRTGSPVGTYVFPIQATASMRMMTPPRSDFLTPWLCK